MTTTNTKYCRYFRTCSGCGWFIRVGTDTKYYNNSNRDPSLLLLELVRQIFDLLPSEIGIASSKMPSGGSLAINGSLELEVSNDDSWS